MGLEVRNLQKKYGDFLISMDFSVADGETLVLVGPSGCGKTTALNLIAGLSEADSGEIIIDGENIRDLPPWKRNVSVVFQDLALFPHLNVGQNIAYGPFIRRTPREERRRITQETLKTVRLSGFEGRRIETLSGGERQRAAIARALAASPRALLLDEPFSSLDAPLRALLREEFLEIRKKSSIPWVFVTHDREEAAILGDRIALLSGGRILEMGIGRDLFLSPKTEFGARFFGAGQVLRGPLLGDITQGGVRVATSLGALTVSRGLENDGWKTFPGEAALFVPHDAVSLAEGGPPTFGASPSPGAKARGRLVGEKFLGNRVQVTLELPRGDLFIFETGSRGNLPPLGREIPITINEEYLRMLIPLDR